MTSYDTTKAIDKALQTLGLNKLCYAVEDTEAYYFTGCGDNGDPIFGGGSCKVFKGSFNSEFCYHDDPCWETPKTKVQIPDDRKEVFIEQKELI